MKEIQRDGFEYELTLNFTLDREGHYASASKDRTGMFSEIDPFRITAETGAKILEWANQGVPKPEPAEPQKPERPPYSKVLEALTACTDLKPLNLIFERACAFEWDMRD